MKAKITKRLVDELRPGPKAIVVFDIELRGFTLKVTPAGRRVYQLRYRMGGRATPLRTYTIGVHGSFTPEQARRTAQALLGDVRRGIDVAADKTRRKVEDRTAPTIEYLSREFLETYGRTKLKPRSYEEYARAFRSHINPRIGERRVRDVTQGDIERLHHDMRATPPTANRTVAALSKFFNWAIRGGYRPDRVNPCQGIEKYREEGRQRYLSAAEIAAVGEAIRTCEATGSISPWHAALFNCLLLTGMRSNELRTLKWDWIDPHRKVFSLPDSKVGRRDIPISGPVQQILDAIPKVEGNPYVFCGAKEGQPIVNLAKPWKRVMDRAGIPPTRVHDLRHTAASVAVSSGASLALIGGVLGHKSQQTTQRYAHLSDDPVRSASEMIAEVIHRNMNASEQCTQIKSDRGSK